MRAFLASISPMTRAADLKKPVVVIHPSKDTRIPVGQAADFAKAVRANGTPVWYIEYTDVGHDNFQERGLQRLQFLLLGPLREDLPAQLISERHVG